jgi:hypothetical protein
VRTSFLTDTTPVRHEFLCIRYFFPFAPASLETAAFHFLFGWLTTMVSR